MTRITSKVRTGFHTHNKCINAKMQTKGGVKDTHRYRHTLTHSGERGKHLTRNTSKDRVGFHTHITHLKIQAQGSAKDKHDYRHTLTRSGVRGHI